MKQFFAACTTALVFITANASAQESPQTLSDALVSAYRNSNLLAQERAVVRAADETLAQAVASLRPVVDFAVSQSWRSVQTTQYGDFNHVARTSLDLTTSMTLLDFGRGALREKLQRETVMVAREALRGVEQNVLNNAVIAYVDYQLRENILKLRESNVNLVRQQLSATKDRFAVGEITRTDVAITEARLAAAQAALDAAKGDLISAAQSYVVAIGAEPKVLAPLPALPALPQSYEAARDLAMKNHPNIRQAQISVAVSDVATEIARLNYAPTVTATATVSKDFEGLDTQSLGIRLNQRLYSGGGGSSLLREAIARNGAARAQLAETGLQVTQALSNAWASLDVFKARVTAGGLQIDASQTAFEGVKEEAELGARTTVDVLNAEQELLNARVAKLESEAQYYVAIYRVLQGTGLLNTAHLGLGVPTYDPNVYYEAVKDAPAHSSRGTKLDGIIKKLQN